MVPAYTKREMGKPRVLSAEEVDSLRKSDPFKDPVWMEGYRRAERARIHVRT